MIPSLPEQILAARAALQAMASEQQATRDKVNRSAKRIEQIRGKRVKKKPARRA